MEDKEQTSIKPQPGTNEPTVLVSRGRAKAQDGSKPRWAFGGGHLPEDAHGIPREGAQ